MPAVEHHLRTISIRNRRFLGNKYRLLPFIKHVVTKECPGVGSFADIFSGTGAVSSGFTDKTLITNDLLYSNYICNYAWFAPMDYDRKKMIAYVDRYNNIAEGEENYMTKNFADTYFSRADCSRIGHIREDIEVEYHKGNLNERERAILIASLIYAMDRIAVTCGHYDAYRKGARYENHLELGVPLTMAQNHPGNACYHEDANQLVKRMEADLVYIDPPYNSRQYCDSYHLLENVARWEKPEVFGVAKKMDRTGMKSRYCTVKAPEAFAELIRDIKAKYILLSYNNMSEKGDSRSNAKISDEDIMRILGSKGEVRVFEEPYRPFTTGKSDIIGNAERLFLCTCFQGVTA